MNNMNILEKISTSDAYEILMKLANGDKSLRQKIEKIAIEQQNNIDFEEIAEEIYFDLCDLYVEDLWDTSGSTRYGYIDPYERAYEMVEEVIEPFIIKMKKLRDLSMFQKEKLCCMGILKGLYKYEKEPKSEFSDWAVDVPRELLNDILDTWRKEQKDEKLIMEMEEFAKTLV